MNGSLLKRPVASARFSASITMKLPVGLPCSLWNGPAITSLCPRPSRCLRCSGRTAMRCSTPLGLSLATIEYNGMLFLPFERPRHQPGNDFVDAGRAREQQVYRIDQRRVDAELVRQSLGRGCGEHPFGKLHVAGIDGGD